MNADEIKKYKKELLTLGILSEDTHTMDEKGRIAQVQTRTLPLGEALSSARAMAGISNSMFAAAVDKGLIKLRY